MQMNNKSVDNFVNKLADKSGAVYILNIIRPLAVRPLNDPELWPTPWGFSFSKAGISERPAFQTWGCGA